MTTRPESTGAPAVTPELFRTATGERLHVRKCASVRSVAIRATPSEVATVPVCRTCQAEIDGHGRTYYPDLDEAMRAYGTFEGTKKQIRDALTQDALDVLGTQVAGARRELGSG